MVELGDSKPTAPRIMRLVKRDLLRRYLLPRYHLVKRINYSNANSFCRRVVSSRGDSKAILRGLHPSDLDKADPAEEVETNILLSQQKKQTNWSYHSLSIIRLDIVYNTSSNRCVRVFESPHLWAFALYRGSPFRR